MQYVEICVTKLDSKYRVVVKIDGKEEINEVTNDLVTLAEKIAQLLKGDRFRFKR